MLRVNGFFCESNANSIKRCASSGHTPQAVRKEEKPTREQPLIWLLRINRFEELDQRIKHPPVTMLRQKNNPNAAKRCSGISSTVLVAERCRTASRKMGVNTSCCVNACRTTVRGSHAPAFSICSQINFDSISIHFLQERVEGGKGSRQWWDRLAESVRPRPCAQVLADVLTEGRLFRSDGDWPRCKSN